MITYNKQTPILFTIFNRLDTTTLVFEQIRKAQPQKLYIAADGPGSDEEEKLCKKTREIINLIDWDCSIKKLFRDKNLGCREAMIEAITWFFEYEPEGIILEDDCLPSDSFFGFCSTLLEEYRNDERIGHITGSNFQNGEERGDGSYYFSSLTHVWGWAGWRRVWKDYDPDMKTFPLFEETRCINNMPSHSPLKSIWISNLKNHHIKSNSWDYQYSYLNMINSRLAVIPNKNLISNIGCNDKATHYTQNHPLANIELNEIDEIIHPTFKVSNIFADIHSQQREYQILTSQEESLEGFQFLQEKLAKLTSQINSSSLHKIPKIIHQIYENPSGPPKILLELAKTWEENHPNWKYCFWNKEAIDNFMAEFYPELIPAYNAFRYPVQRWDAIRYLILYRIGGLYVDLDYECLEPITPLLLNSTCCLALEPALNAIKYNKPYIIGNALMASIPNHSYFKMVIDDVFYGKEKYINEDKGTEIVESTGPFMMNRVYDAYSEKENITLIPGDLVTPLTYSEVRLVMKGQGTKEIEIKVEKAYAIHYFFGSWWRQ